MPLKTSEEAAAYWTLKPCRGNGRGTAIIKLNVIILENRPGISAAAVDLADDQAVQTGAGLRQRRDAGS